MSSQTLLDGVVFVDRDGFYVGDASPFDLYRAAVAVTTRKNEELDAKNRALHESAARLSLESDRAMAASRSKSEFLATISHEIRTPLNGVLGMAQALRTEALDPSAHEKVAVILESGQSLLSLLNDVLDLSKIEAGRLEIAPSAGDIRQTIYRTCELFQASAKEKGIALRVSIPEEFPARLSYDALRIRQCLSNLVANGVKFTASGEVTVSAWANPLSASDHEVSIEVTDAGIGMTPATQARLFEAFSQADSSTTRKYGGSGLGLTISRHLSRLMGGDLRLVSSAPGAGSTFSMTFIAQSALEAGSPAEEGSFPTALRSFPGSLRDRRILLTDDNAINRQVIRLFLAPLGCEIVEAVNGEDALKQLTQQPFDLVLMDVHMPVMDGKAAIRAIRTSGATWNDIVVVALTADAMLGDREQLLALGMTDYLPKPVDQNDLIAKLTGLLGPARRTDLRRAV